MAKFLFVIVVIILLPRWREHLVWNIGNNFS